MNGVNIKKDGEELSQEEAAEIIDRVKGEKEQEEWLQPLDPKEAMELWDELNNPASSELETKLLPETQSLVKQQVESTMLGSDTPTYAWKKRKSTGEVFLKGVDNENEFTVLGDIGGGAFGRVFRVQNKSGEVRALKLLRSRDSKIKRLFKKEMDTIRKLDHPGIASIEDAGEIAYVDGQGDEQYMPFFVTEIFDESFLQMENQIQEMSSTELLDFMDTSVLGAAEGLEAAHNQGVLHRDVKPGNMMKKKNGKGVMIDFGMPFDLRNYVAQQLEETEEIEKKIWGLDEEGKPMKMDVKKREKITILGTPLFMAPEYVTDKYLPGSPVSDWYGFAASLYMMITGDSVPPNGLNTGEEVTMWLKKYKDQSGIYTSTHRKKELEKISTTVNIRGSYTPSAEYTEAYNRVSRNLNERGVGPNLKKLILRLLRPSTVRIVDTEETREKQYRVKPGESVPQSIRKAVQRDRILLDLSKAPSLQERNLSQVEGLVPIDEGEDEEITEPMGLHERELISGDEADITIFTPGKDMRVKLTVGELLHEQLVKEQNILELRKVEIKNKSELERFEELNGIDGSIPYELYLDRYFGDSLIYAPQLNVNIDESEKQSVLYQLAEEVAPLMSGKNIRSLLEVGEDMTDKQAELAQKYFLKKGFKFESKGEFRSFYAYLLLVAQANMEYRANNNLKFDVNINIAYYHDREEAVKIQTK
jgi:serine/threonine protein kinase